MSGSGTAASVRAASPNRLRAAPTPRHRSKLLFLQPHAPRKILDRALRLVELLEKRVLTVPQRGAAAVAGRRAIGLEPRDRPEVPFPATGAADRPIVVVVEHWRFASLAAALLARAGADRRE